MNDITVAGTWPLTLQHSHINMLELLAIFHAVRAFQSVMTGKHVLLCTDNTTVACYVNKQGGARSPALSLATEDLLLFCHSRDIILTARHVPGILNIVADALSRPHSVLPTEWTLSHRVLRPLWLQWFQPMIDLFATRFNHRLPIYVSPVPDPGAWEIDALTMSWANLLAYAFPPFPILGKVVRKARLERPRLILIAPWWPAQPWFQIFCNYRTFRQYLWPSNRAIWCNRGPESRTEIPPCYTFTRGFCAVRTACIRGVGNSPGTYPGAGSARHKGSIFLSLAPLV